MSDRPTPQELDEQYLPAPEFARVPGVPEGEVTEFIGEAGTVFPGATRTIGVYVPAQYDGTPACVYVAFDGLGNLPAAFDSLIHAGEMPVTIAIGLGSGSVASETGENPRLQRSLEFDGMTGDLARLLLEEVFPAVERRTTAGGLPIRLSDSPDDRAAGGLSTGGIGAFTLAWERPDVVRRVCSGIGTFVGMRGGDRYPVLVRKTEPKPIRVFLQGGANDGLPGHLDEVGDWWMGNQTLQRALAYAGYPVRHEFGEGLHSGRHMAAVFPDAMRWLWAGWPAAVQAGTTENTYLRAAILPGEDWQTASDAEAPAGLAADRQLEALGPNGTRYVLDPERGELRIERDGASTVADSDLEAPSAVAISPDGLWLAVAERTDHSGHSYRVRTDGSVDLRQRFYAFHTPDTGHASGTRGWVFDVRGTLYAATAMGVQIFDRNGRVRAILPSPDRSPLTAIAFGGPGDPERLYVRTAEGTTFRRKLAIPGAAEGADPISLPEWSAG